MTETHSLNSTVIYTSSFSSKFTKYGFQGMSSQNNGFLKMFKSISMAWRPGLQILQEGLAKEECSKEHFKKFIIQSSSLSHKMLVSNVDLAKCQESQNIGFKG